MTGNPDAYTSYKDTHRLIDDKQTQEEYVDNPLVEDDNDVGNVDHEQIDDKPTQEEYVGNLLADENVEYDVDHEQIELRPVVVESQPAGDLHACETQTSSADLELTEPTSPVIGSETHVDTHDDTTTMMSLRLWDPECKHDDEGEEMELQLIQTSQSAAGSSPHASAASMLSDSAHGGTQPQGDGQQQGSGADHEEVELREINDDSFDKKSHQPSMLQNL